MISLWDFLRDVRNVHHGFLAASLLMGCVAAMTAGAAGTYVVVRGRRYALDLMVCAALPAAAVCLLLPGSPLLSAVISVGVVVITTVFYRLLSAATSADGARLAALAVMGSATGAAALVMAWRRPENIVSQLAGSMRATTMHDLVVVTVLCCGALVVLTIAHRFLAAAGFHRRGMQRMVWRSTVLDATLGSCLALSVVALARPVGVVAGLALLALLPSVAWFLTRRLSTMILTSVALGAVATVMGVYAAWCSHLPQGPQIVGAAAALAVVVAAVSPLRLLTTTWSVRRPTAFKRAAVVSAEGVVSSEGSPAPAVAGPVLVTVSADHQQRGSGGGRVHETQAGAATQVKGGTTRGRA